MQLDARSAFILSLLVNREGYGREIIARAARVYGSRLRLGAATLYPVLRDLEDAGLLAARSGESLPERGSRPRTYYSITGAGHVALVDYHRATSKRRFSCACTPDQPSWPVGELSFPAHACWQTTGHTNETTCTCDCHHLEPSEPLRLLGVSSFGERQAAPEDHFWLLLFLRALPGLFCVVVLIGLLLAFWRDCGSIAAVNP